VIERKANFLPEKKKNPKFNDLGKEPISLFKAFFFLLIGLELRASCLQSRDCTV
jgi:hypothetical protein